jgi:glutamate synthase domain-containing protein 2
MSLFDSPPAPFQPRYLPLTACVSALVLSLLFLAFDILPAPLMIIVFLIFAAGTALGVHDLIQASHSILRNYPITAHLRFILEKVRPEIRQYFLEGDKDGTPFSRDKRAIVYQRAKAQLDKRPFGTQYDVYHNSFEWLHHSLAAGMPSSDPFRIMIGGEDCKQPYSASVFNISAMSYGALSTNAVLAMNKGAALGGFYQDTGEGGFTPYHQRYGADIVWEIGSGYFGCRNDDGSFNAERFAETAKNPVIKMIELKLSQGAKPGHGGVLPASKITPEISAIRGVPMGQDCVSPPSHSAFSTPREMMLFIKQLRELSGGKPVGFKLCIGHRWEFLAVVKAMLETGITPDYIVVDGKEGGTGAAPIEFMDHIGMPLRDGLAFVHSALTGAGLRQKIRIGASAKVTTAFDITRLMALGADWCNAARGFMFAVGCIQAQTCHTGKCPTGVTAQDPLRQRGLVVEDKAERVARFHKETLHALAELVAACGLEHPSQFQPHHFMRRMANEKVVTFADLYTFMPEGALLGTTLPPDFSRDWAMAQPDSFAPAA